VKFHAKHTEWLKWISHPNLTIVPEKDQEVFNANTGYKEQLEASRTGKCQSRSLWYMQNIHALHSKIRGEPQPARPIKYESVGTCSDLPAKYIVLAPFSAYTDRQWNMQHWRMLARVLMNEGHTVIAIGAANHVQLLQDSFAKTGVRYFWGQSPEWTVKAIRHAQFLIGNDSGPAHVAGLYGSNAIALCGQIDGHFVYRHSPSVIPVHPPKHVPCAPCHWKAEGGYTTVCSQSCSALQLISPFEIADLAINRMKESNESVSNQEGEREASLSRPQVRRVQQAYSSARRKPQEKDGAGKKG
jgi:hypothetical protein